LIVERDPSGRVIPQAEQLIEPAAPGSDIQLTIDRDIQYIVEQQLADAIIRTNSLAGSVVVLGVGTGEILAMASSPGFDPTERSTIRPENVRNRAVSEVFEPGSTLKAIVVAAALEAGIVAPDIAIDTPENLEIGEHSYEDPSSHPDRMSVADVLAHSSNTGAINIQRLLGNERHYEYLDAFGLGRPASIDFPGEASGDLPHVGAWCLTCGPSAAIGYGVSTTALQLASAFGVFANSGEWVEPYVVSEIVHADGTSDLTEPRRHRAISAQTALAMRRMLQRVVDIGTGTRAAVAGYTAAGKTGTTERFDVELQRYSDTDTIVNFVGMAPANDPRIVIAVVLDTPSGELEDGTDMRLSAGSAAPAFAEIAGPVLHVLGVPPDRPFDED
jgi:cell division protein FtsI (penicillin-binding protein 3)